MSASSWSESLGVHAGRLVTQFHQQLSCSFDEWRRTTNVDGRAFGRFKTDGAQHLRVDPPAEPVPPLRHGAARQRDVHADGPTAESIELVAVEHVVDSARRKQQASVDSA